MKIRNMKYRKILENALLLNHKKKEKFIIDYNVCVWLCKMIVYIDSINNEKFHLLKLYKRL